MPSSIVVHIHNGWIGSSLVNLHPSPSLMLHLEPHYPRPKHWGPTPSTIALKLVWPKLVLGVVDTALQQLLGDSTRALLWHEHDYQLFYHFAFEQPWHLLRCERSSWHGLDVKDLLQKLKASQVWTFLPLSHAPVPNAWSTTIWHNMRQCKCQLYTSISTQPLSIPCPSKPN
jgi:hypothetical protein